MNKKVTHITLTMMLTLGAIAGLTPLAMDMYLPALPVMAADLETSINSIQFTLTIYMAGFALGQLIHGPLSDSYGRKAVLLLGIMFFGFAALSSVFMPTAFSLSMTRLIQGVCGATGAVVLMALIRDMFNREEFSRVMSLVSLVMTIAPLIAPLFGGYITVLFGWRAIFLLLAILALILVVLIMKYLPETLDIENRQPLKFGNVFNNYLKVLRNRRSIGLIICDSLAFTGMFSFLAVGSFVYIKTYGVKIEHFGYLFALNIVTMIILTLLNAKCVTRVGIHPLLRLGLLLLLLASCGLVAVYKMDVGIWGIVPCIMVYVGSIGLINSNCMALLLSDYSNLAGTASALAGMLRFGTAAVLGSIVASSPYEPILTLVVSMTVCAIGATLSYVVFSRKV